MRVGIYKDTLANRRGADVAVLALAEGLRERGHAAEVFERRDFDRRISEPWDAVISTGTNELLDLAARWGQRALPQFPLPVIQQFHTEPKSQFKWKRIVRNWKIRRALKRVNVIQVLSEELVSQVSMYGVPVRVIGNFSLTSATEGQEPDDSATHPPTVICPAAFQRVKYQDLLIRSFADIADEFPKWNVRFLGSDNTSHARRCRKLVSELGLDGRIAFCGFSKNLEKEYEDCAFVAFPSHSEGFGLVILDAAKFGKPAVMVRDWIGTAGAGGGIVTMPTPKAYAEGLRRFMSDPVLCRQMGERAREFCAERYSREKILDEWEQLLDMVKSSGRFACASAEYGV